MEEIVKVVGEYGILVMIAVVFVMDRVRTGKVQTDLLHQIDSDHKVVNEAIAVLRQESTNAQTLLNIINISLTGYTSALERHDSRAESINKDLQKAITLLEGQYAQHKEI